jgi:hypothetical protein
VQVDAVLAALRVRRLTSYTASLTIVFGARPKQHPAAMTLKISPVFLALAFAAHADAPAAVSSLAKVGEAEGVTVQIKVQAPSGQDTPLQVACVFEYVEGDLTTPPALPAALNGMLHLDQALHGLITDLRRTGRFKGHALETLLIAPPAGEIPAHQLLLIGLGDRKAFSPELMKRVGATGMREALRLGVTDYFAH